MAVGVQNVFYLGKWQLIFHSHGGWALIDRFPITPYLSQPHSFSSIPLSMPFCSPYPYLAHLFLNGH